MADPKITFDDFEDNSENTSKWTYAGTHAEESGGQRVGKKSGSGGSGSAHCSGKIPDNRGIEWVQTWDAGGSEGPDVYGRFVSTDGWVEARSQHAVNTTAITAGGGFSGSTSHSGKTTTMKVIEENGKIYLYLNGASTPTLTLKNSPFTDKAPYVENVSEGGDGTNFNNVFSIVYYFPRLSGGFAAMLD